MVPRRARPLRLALLVLAALALLAAAVGPVAAQVPPERVPRVGLAVSLGASFLLNLVVGAVVVAVSPAFVRDALRRVRDAPGAMALYGLLTFVGGLVALFALAITVIGLIVAVPGFFAFFVYLIVTGVVGGVVVGYLLLDAVADATLWSGLVVGSLLVAVLGAIPVVGGLLGFVVSLLGTGAVSKRLYERYRG